jgi:hypothetical protein
VSTPGASQWPLLFDIAIKLIDQAEAAVGHRPIWSFGGGTALMLQIDHRESHDIDLFIDDPQILPFLNPVTQAYALDRQPDAYQSDGTRAIKLIFEGMGEIDFICCADITDDPTALQSIRGQNVALERPSEIIAKKIFYRGSHMQPRDMFDLAAVVAHYGEDYVVAALRQCGIDRCAIALNVAKTMKPSFAQGINGQLLFRDQTAHLVGDAQSVTQNLLRSAL